MDEQLEQMQRFLAELEQFNHSLDRSMLDLAMKHDAVSPHWQDSFRKDYDARWKPFIEQMKTYLNREAPSYEQFFRDKANDLRRYLHGH